MEFKDKIKAARKQLFMSQETFAKELGVTFATVNRWETGKHAPSYPAQKAFHDFCLKNDISFDQLQK